MTAGMDLLEKLTAQPEQVANGFLKRSKKAGTSFIPNGYGAGLR